MMRASLLCLMFFCCSLQAAELQLELPRGEWSLQAIGPPLMQREGAPLPAEQESMQRLVGFIDREQFNEALDYARNESASLLELLESGDLGRQLPVRVVAGGFTPTVGRNQSSAALLYLLGHVYMMLEQYLPAETALKAALVPMPDYVRVHESLGLLYLLTERPDDARKHLARAAALGLNTPNLHGALGYINQQDQNYWGAASAYQNAMMLDADNRQWQQGLLYSLAQSRQHASALSLVEQMLQDYPDEADLWLFRSQMSLLAGNRDSALSSLETALRLGNDAPANLQVGATLHMERGSIARAVDLLGQGHSQGIEYTFMDQALAWLALKGEWVRMEELLVAMRPASDALNAEHRSKFLTREASLDLQREDTNRARSNLQQAIELDPANAEALMALANIHRDNRNYNQAELLYQRASAEELYRENAWISMAQLAIDQDNFERALQLLRDVVNRNPVRSDLVRNIASLENLVLLRE
jgi:tetratricopeptide (TPR) repeat protein